jgi:hypothetical protein
MRRFLRRQAAQVLQAVLWKILLLRRHILEICIVIVIGNAVKKNKGIKQKGRRGLPLFVWHVILKGAQGVSRHSEGSASERRIT